MPRPSKHIPIRLLAAARDGDLGLTDGADKAGVSKQVFDTRLRKFKAEQAKQRTTKALRAAADWLAFCQRIGFKRSELDELEVLWWCYHDENGNLLSSARNGRYRR